MAVASPKSEGLRSLQLPLAALLAAGALVAAAGWYGNRTLTEAHKRLSAQRAALALATQQYQKSDEEKELIIAHKPRYLDLQGLGFIGPENRINWLDALRAANQQLGLFGVDYAIDAQQPSLLSIETGNYRLMESDMSVQLALLHEGDLLKFLDALNTQRAGIFTVRDCGLKRTSGNVFDPVLRPNLNAECTLSWLTLQEKGPSPR